MSYEAETADQFVRYTLNGTEMAVRLTGEAAKHFALFAAAELRDHEKKQGRTTLTRMLKEDRVLNFYVIPQERLKEFERGAKARGLLYVQIRENNAENNVELAVWERDVEKMKRVLETLQLDYVQADTGSQAKVAKYLEGHQAPCTGGQSLVPDKADKMGYQPPVGAEAERKSGAKPSVRQELLELKRSSSGRHADVPHPARTVRQGKWQR